MDEHERSIRRLRFEARTEREELEAAEGALALARRQLSEELERWARLGQDLVVDLPGHIVQGVICHLGASAVMVRHRSGRRELIDLAAVEGVRPLETAADTIGSGRSGHALAPTTGHPGSVIAQLRALVETDQEAELYRRSCPPVQGRLTGVSSSVVGVRASGGVEVLVPIRAVVSVVIGTGAQ
jgi:hypothetical protein